MRVVRDDKRYSCLAVQLYESVTGALLLLYAVVLNFQIKVPFAEKLAELQRLGPGPFIVPAYERLRNFAGETAGETYESLGMLTQQRPVYARLDIKALGKGRRDQIAEISVAGLVFAQEYQMGILIIGAMLLVAHTARSDIDFAADDRLDAGGLARAVKVDRSVHDAVIRDRDRVLSQLLYALCQQVYAAGPVEQGIFTVHMQMNKCHFFIPQA